MSREVKELDASLARGERIERAAFIVIICAVAVFFLLLILSPDAEARKPRHDTALWLARSCIGEAGWMATGSDESECVAIWHIYKKRMKPTGMSLYRVTRKYSAAVKKGQHHRKPWIFGLNRDLKRPKGWPKNLSWENHIKYWRHALVMADRFIRGAYSDPLPEADHFGGKIDHWRAVRAGWTKLETIYQNNFYSIK